MTLRLETLGTKYIEFLLGFHLYCILISELFHCEVLLRSVKRYLMFFAVSLCCKATFLVFVWCEFVNSVFGKPSPEYFSKLRFFVKCNFKSSNINSTNWQKIDYYFLSNVFIVSLFFSCVYCSKSENHFLSVALREIIETQHLTGNRCKTPPN